MGTPWPENQCAHRKRKIEKLIQDQARDMAAQLQILPEKPTGDHDGLEKLLEKRFISFTESLSHVSLCRCKDCECEVTQIPNRVGSPISDQISVDPGESKRPAAEDRRGSFERKFRVAERSFPSKTFSSDSESHSRSFPSQTISTQNTTSTPSSGSSAAYKYKMMSVIFDHPKSVPEVAEKRELVREEVVELKEERGKESEEKEEEEEEGVGLMSAEELNKKCEEFIRKMREGIKIEAQNKMAMAY